MASGRSKRLASPVVPYRPGNRVCEFRIPLPCTVEEYQIAQTFMVSKNSKQAVAESDGAGISLLANESFENEYGKGRYTEKIYKFSDRIPAALKKMLPKSAQIMEERCWYTYPKIRTQLSIPYLNKASIIIETTHLAIDESGALEENALRIEDAKLLKKRTIKNIDICDSTLIPAAEYTDSEDPTLISSEKAGRGPLQKGFGWLEHTGPKMCCYKVVYTTFEYMGLQKKIEEYFLGEYEKAFLVSHRQLFCWMDEWFGMSLEEVRLLEDKVFAELSQPEGNSLQERSPEAGEKGEAAETVERSGPDGADGKANDCKVVSNGSDTTNHMVQCGRGNGLDGEVKDGAQGNDGSVPTEDSPAHSTAGQ